MARFNPDRDARAIFEASRAWTQRCLIRDSSILSNEELWSRDLVEELFNAFVQNPDESEARFLDKLEQQLRPAPAAASKLMAEMLWILLLFPARMTARKKREIISEVWLIGPHRVVQPQR